MKEKLKFIAANFIYLILAILAYGASGKISFWFNEKDIPRRLRPRGQSGKNNVEFRATL